jgi:hypothetical protein
VIERLPVLDIIPKWRDYPANRYMSHPQLRTAIIQCDDDPLNVYVVSDQVLPQTSQEAMDMVQQWRVSRATQED